MALTHTLFSPGELALQVGEKARALRLTQNISRKTLAERAGVSECGFHAIRPPSPLSSGQAFHGHLATCSTAIRPGSRSAATQGLHC